MNCKYVLCISCIDQMVIKIELGVHEVQEFMGRGSVMPVKDKKRRKSD